MRCWVPSAGLLKNANDAVTTLQLASSIQSSLAFMDGGVAVTVNNDVSGADGITCVGAHVDTAAIHNDSDLPFGFQDPFPSAHRRFRVI
jgi:uncharacterized protein GlcG (DUF336 family)